MKLIGLALMVVLASSLALGARDLKPCCYPPKFRAGISALTGQIQQGVPIALSLFMDGAYDLTKNSEQSGFNMYITYPNGTATSVRIIQKFALQTQWVIIDAEQFCLKQMLTTPPPQQCIPDGANYTASTTLGGANGTMIDSYVFSYPTVEGGYQGTATLSVVSGGGCMPVGSTFMGNYVVGSTTVPMVTSVGYSNYTLGIPDPGKWFNVPTFCGSQEHDAHPVAEEAHQIIHEFGKHGIF